MHVIFIHDSAMIATEHTAFASRWKACVARNFADRER